MKHAVVTGAAGFIGSTLVDRLLTDGWRVTGYDNFSTGLPEFLAEARRHAGFALIEGDLHDRAALDRAVGGADMVFHLAANADVRHGTEHPGRDLEQNTIGTFNLLEAARTHELDRFLYASTIWVYGNAPGAEPHDEDTPFVLPPHL